MLLDVTHVVAQPNFTLLLEFENGERRSFNMAIYIDQKPWIRLKSGNVFMGAFVENGTVAWPGNIDIEARGSIATLSSLSSWERVGVRVIECRFTSAWLNIDPETLYERSVPLTDQSAYKPEKD